MEVPLSDSPEPVVLLSSDTPLLPRAEHIESQTREQAQESSISTGFASIQYVCRVSAYVMSALSVCVVAWWTSKLGGFAWTYGHSKQTFNWHPLLMTVTFAIMTLAALSFRSFPLQQHSTAKMLHGASWSVAAILSSVALRAVFRSHNDPLSGYTANFYSFHSWMGALVSTLFLAQLTAGAVAFAWSPPSLSATTKYTILQVHRVLGPIIYVLVAVTMMLGIQEKEVFVDCSYKVYDAQFLPKLSHIPVACRISHLLGLLLMATTVCTLLALYEP
jgi:Eukaryotic cytochrome b561